MTATRNNTEMEPTLLVQGAMETPRMCGRVAREFGLEILERRMPHKSAWTSAIGAKGILGQTSGIQPERTGKQMKNAGGSTIRPRTEAGPELIHMSLVLVNTGMPGIARKLVKIGVI